MWLLLLGLIVHGVLMTSVYDIYFTTYIVKGESAECGASDAPAQRLFFMISDGLRADLLWRNKEGRAGRAVGDGAGSWAVSRASVPTSSFPGTMSLTAGIYADPVVQNFRKHFEKPPRWDHFLNRAKFVAFFGSDAVRNYYKKCAPVKHWYSKYLPEYSSEEMISSKVDEFVVEGVEELFNLAKENKTLSDKLHKDKVIFFLHFGAMDKISHSYGPHSLAAANATNYLCKLIDRMIETVDKFYKDERTAYILTSDHGHNDWGSHGGGSPDETNTPLVVWGAGVAKSTTKHFVRQIDVAPLAATLIGSSPPFNSIGTLPSNMLDFSPKGKCEAIACNALQLRLLAEKSGEKVPSCWNGYDSKYSLYDKFTVIEYYIKKGNYTTASSLSEELIQYSLLKFQWNESFFRILLYVYFVLISTGWAIILLTHTLPDTTANTKISVIKWLKVHGQTLRSNPKLNYFISSLEVIKRKKHTDNNTDENAAPNTNITLSSVSKEGESSTSGPEIKIIEVKTKHSNLLSKILRPVIDAVFTVSIIMQIVLIHYVKWPVHFLFYFILPLLLWWIISYKIATWSLFLKSTTQNIRKKIILSIVLSLVTAEYLYHAMKWKAEVSYGTGILVMLPIYLKSEKWKYIVMWIYSLAAIMVLSIFKRNLYDESVLPWSLYSCSGGAIIVSVMWIWKEKLKGYELFITLFSVVLQMAALSVVIIHDTYYATDTPESIKIISWSILIVSLLIPAVPYTRNPKNSLIKICICFSVPLILTSTSYEPLIFIFMSLLMKSWLELEDEDSNKLVADREFSFEDVRRSVFLVAFYAIFLVTLGNRATLSSFSLLTTRHFLSKIKELYMSILIIIKVMLFFVILTGNFLVISFSSGIKTRKVYPFAIFLMNMIAWRVSSMITHETAKTNPNDIISTHCFVHILIIFMIASIYLCECFYRAVPFKSKVK